jgi:hypothetical protein
MNAINYILFAVIALLFFVQKFIFRHYSKDKVIKKITNEKFKLLLINLSKSVNNQRMLFLVDDHLVFILNKYQLENYWGIALCINFEMQLGDLLYSNYIKPNPKISYKEKKILKFENDITKVYEILTRFIFREELKFKIIIESNARHLYR